MSLKFPFQRTKSNTFIPDSDESTSTSSKLQAQLKLTRKSISEATHPILPAIHTSSGKKKTMDPAALLLKAALDQPFLEQAIIPLHLFTPNVENLKIEDDQLDCWFTNVEECLKELETCQCSIVEQSKELTTMLSRFELGSLSGMSDKNYCITNADLSPIAFNHFKNLKDRLSLFSITCQAMADTAAEFVLLAAETHHSKQHPAPHEEHETEVNSLNPVSEDWENEQEEYFDALDLGPVGEEIGFQERREEDMLEKSLPTNISNGFLTHQHKPVQQRRKRVPFRPISSINYLSLMKNCIGKDLSKMAMPVSV
uniref:Uncharacterized protein n=1 Tax=Ditylenchus dipsaci TaxID=166011 RepID=A0A915DZV5_9BILA